MPTLRQVALYNHDIFEALDIPVLKYFFTLDYSTFVLFQTDCSESFSFDKNNTYSFILLTRYLFIVSFASIIVWRLT